MQAQSKSPHHWLRTAIPDRIRIMPISPTPSLPASKWQQQFAVWLPPQQRGCIWIHACSVGEVASIAPLLHNLKKQGHTLHLTVVTATGFAHANRLFNHLATISYLPWDLPFNMKRLVKQLQPALLLLTETEFWPGMLNACKQNNIPIIGINTRISDRSFPRYKATRLLWKKWLKPVSLFLAQSPEDAERLIAMGVSARKVKAIGNLKYAATAPDVDSNALRKRLDASGQRPILLIASSHNDEEKQLLKMWPTWHQHCPELLTIIVPRHPERFDEVAELITSQGHTLSRWSETMQHHANFILIDAMGVLGSLYTVADLVIIAGSLSNIGGHNPLEAAVCGRGVVTGPHIQNFRAMMQHMIQMKAAIVCASVEEMEHSITQLLQYPDQLQDLHKHAALMMQQHCDTLQKMMNAITPWLPVHPQHDA